MRQTLRIELESAAESAATVRASVRLLGQTSGLPAPLIEDVVTAVSEACNNVVLHAYPDAPGPFEFQLVIGDTSVRAEVRDFGCGARTLVSDGGGLGLGVGLIRKLADVAEFDSRLGAGTTVTMGFPRGAGDRSRVAGEKERPRAEHQGSSARHSHSRSLEFRA
jgi:anti-sigma regulatory factor (Ser/Thr protein kinase)